jgi:hypothetical protein
MCEGNGRALFAPIDHLFDSEGVRSADMARRCLAYPLRWVCDHAVYNPAGFKGQSALLELVNRLSEQQNTLPTTYIATRLLVQKPAFIAFFYSLVKP